MDEVVIKAMAKWPNVPAVYGWLSLDARGRWRIKGDIIAHRPSLAFIARNYAADERGCWYFQNGPQRVFVELEYTPWVLRLAGDRSVETHTGHSVHNPRAAYVDEQGNLLIESELGIGLVEDRELEQMSEGITLGSGESADPEQIAQVLERGVASAGASLVLSVGGRRLAVHGIARADVPSRFGYVASPSDDER